MEVKTLESTEASAVGVEPARSLPSRTIPMDYVRPPELVEDAIGAAVTKAFLPLRDMVVRGFLAGAFLGFATSLAAMTVSQGLPRIVGALVFPAGFVMLALLGLELATGNFALLPKAWAAGRVSLGPLVRNWTWVYLANLAGCLFYALLFVLSVTQFGTSDGGPLAEQVRSIAQAKTLAYRSLGLRGWGAAFVRGVLANWMVTVGAIMAFVARSTVGKVVAMWLPIMTFFALGYEHSIVNMFVIPAGMMLGAPVSTADWWLWNQIPVTLGNIVGGAVLTGGALYATYRPTSA